MSDLTQLREQVESLETEITSVKATLESLEQEAESYIAVTSTGNGTVLFEKESLVVEENVGNEKYTAYADNFCRKGRKPWTTNHREDPPREYGWHFSEMDGDVGEYLVEDTEEDGDDDTEQEGDEDGVEWVREALQNVGIRLLEMHDEIKRSEGLGDYHLQFSEWDVEPIRSRNVRAIQEIDGLEIAYVGWSDDGSAPYIRLDDVRDDE